MFGSVLNTPLNTISLFFWRFQIKVNDFFNFFSTINCSYQYLPEAKAYLEPTWTLYNRVFSQNIFLSKIHKKTPVLESHFHKVIGLYAAISLKERTPRQVFSAIFARYLRHIFYRTLPGHYFCSTEKNILSIK